MTPQEHCHNKFVIQRFVQEAERLSQQKKYDEALRILTQAYSIDPFDEGVQELERQILLLQAQTFRTESAPGAPTETEMSSELSAEAASRIGEHIAQAYQFRKSRNYARALHEIAEALFLDPLSELLHQLEREIFTEYKKSQHGQVGTRESDIPKGGNGRAAALGTRITPSPREVPQREEPSETSLMRPEDEHYERAKQLLQKKAFEEALSEIALGLVMDDRSEKLKRLEQEVWRTLEAHLPPVQKEHSDVDQGVLQDYLRSAEEYLKQRQIEKALEELIKVYMIDPLNADANKLEQRIRQAQMKDLQ